MWSKLSKFDLERSFLFFILFLLFFIGNLSLADASVLTDKLTACKQQLYEPCLQNIKNICEIPWKLITGYVIICRKNEQTKCESEYLGCTTKARQQFQITIPTKLPTVPSGTITKPSGQPTSQTPSSSGSPSSSGQTTPSGGGPIGTGGSVGGQTTPSGSGSAGTGGSVGGQTGGAQVGVPGTTPPPAVPGTVPEGGTFTLPNLLKAETFEELIIGIFNAIMPIVMVLAVFFIILAGFQFVTAQGKEQDINKAKETLKWTIIGVAVVVGARLIVEIVKDILQSI